MKRLCALFSAQLVKGKGKDKDARGRRNQNLAVRLIPTRVVRSVALAISITEARCRLREIVSDAVPVGILLKIAPVQNP